MCTVDKLGRCCHLRASVCDKNVREPAGWASLQFWRSVEPWWLGESWGGEAEGPFLEQSHSQHLPAVNSSQFEASLGSRILAKQGCIGSHYSKKEEGKEEERGALSVGWWLVVFTHVLRSSQLFIRIHPVELVWPGETKALGPQMLASPINTSACPEEDYRLLRNQLWGPCNGKWATIIIMLHISALSPTSKPVEN